MDKKNTVTIRLTDEQFGWLRALSRRSKRSQSEVVRSLIEHGTVRERITRENLDIIRKLIGESTNLNQLAKRAYGFYRVADECRAVAQKISQLIKQLKDDR
jgi:predicted CopG family antitoxin